MPKWNTIVPPIFVIKELHKVFAKFFWTNKESGRSEHWSAWNKVCFPKKEGGLDLDLYLMFQRPCTLNYCGNSGHKIVYGLTFLGTNIVRSRSLLFFNGRVVLRYGNLCCRMET